jgi:hypothetical protein
MARSAEAPPVREAPARRRSSQQGAAEQPAMTIRVAPSTGEAAGKTDAAYQSSIPPLRMDGPPQEKDLHWFRHCHRSPPGRKKFLGECIAVGWKILEITAVALAVPGSASRSVGALRFAAHHAARGTGVVVLDQERGSRIGDSDPKRVTESQHPASAFRLSGADAELQTWHGFIGALRTGPGQS